MNDEGSVAGLLWWFLHKILFLHSDFPAHLNNNGHHSFL